VEGRSEGREEGAEGTEGREERKKEESLRGRRIEP